MSARLKKKCPDTEGVIVQRVQTRSYYLSSYLDDELSYDNDRRMHQVQIPEQALIKHPVADLFCLKHTPLILSNVCLSQVMELEDFAESSTMMTWEWKMRYKLNGFDKANGRIPPSSSASCPGYAGNSRSSLYQTAARLLSNACLSRVMELEDYDDDDVRVEDEIQHAICYNP